MIYLSKGLVCKGSTEEILEITHCGHKFTLTGQLAYTWLNGRYRILAVDMPLEKAALRQLVRMGIAEAEESDTAVNRYRILSRCILCPTNAIIFSRGKKGMERTILIWLRKAGLRLSTAELVCLFEQQIQPVENLLYERNRQVLVEKLYSANTIMDGILETQMEHAASRDAVVNCLQILIAKKKVVIL